MQVIIYHYQKNAFQNFKGGRGEKIKGLRLSIYFFLGAAFFAGFFGVFLAADFLTAGFLAAGFLADLAFLGVPAFWAAVFFAAFFFGLFVDSVFLLFLVLDFFASGFLTFLGFSSLAAL